MAFGLMTGLLVIAALEAWVVLGSLAHPEVTVGLDLRIYLERTRSWLAGDGFYLPLQVAGPYLVNAEVVPTLYPPLLLYVLVPLTVMPEFLWWLVPLTIIGFSLHRMHPAMWAWPILAAILVYPRTWMVLLYGNPSLWVFAALAAGLVWRWPLAFVPIKLTLAPFALVGIRSRGLWKGAGLAVILALPFGAMWFDYVTATLNARNGFGWEYLLGEVPIGLALVAGWWSGRR